MAKPTTQWTPASGVTIGEEVNLKDHNDNQLKDEDGNNLTSGTATLVEKPKTEWSE